MPYPPSFRQRAFTGALTAFLALSGGSFSGAAQAQQAAPDMTALARQKNCMSCHTVERKVIGPAFKDVAARYAGQKDAAEKLAHKIVTGGSGNWGVLSMPANRQVSDAEARQLAGWILSMKPAP